jgi:hypothetical protein
LTGLLENEVKALPLKHGAVSFDLHPFEIVTLKFTI